MSGNLFDSFEREALALAAGKLAVRMTLDNLVEQAETNIPDDAVITKAVLVDWLRAAAEEARAAEGGV